MRGGGKTAPPPNREHWRQSVQINSQTDVPHSDRSSIRSKPTEDLNLYYLSARITTLFIDLCVSFIILGFTLIRVILIEFISVFQILLNIRYINSIRTKPTTLLEIAAGKINFLTVRSEQIIGSIHIPDKRII